MQKDKKCCGRPSSKSNQLQPTVLLAASPPSVLSLQVFLIKNFSLTDKELCVFSLRAHMGEHAVWRRQWWRRAERRRGPGSTTRRPASTSTSASTPSLFLAAGRILCLPWQARGLVIFHCIIQWSFDQFMYENCREERCISRPHGLNFLWGQSPRVTSWAEGNLRFGGDLQCDVQRSLSSLPGKYWF